MDVKTDDVLYLVAIRAREGDGGRSMQEVLKRLDFPSDGEYSAHVVAKPLRDAYSLRGDSETIPTVQNMNEALRVLGFDFDSANQREAEGLEDELLRAWSASSAERSGEA
jgi:hypothetical protein